MTGYRVGGRVPRVLLVSFQLLHKCMQIETRVIFLMDRVAWGVLRFSPVIIIPPLLLSLSLYNAGN